MNTTNFENELEKLCVSLSKESRTLEHFEEVACHVTGIRPVDLFSPGRHRINSSARHLCFIYLRSQFKVHFSTDNLSVLKRKRISLSEIGWRYTNRDHSTVVYGVSTFKRFLFDGDKYACRLWDEFTKYINIES